MQSSYRQQAQICRVVKLQAHFKKKRKKKQIAVTDDKSSCWDFTMTHIIVLGHLDFPSTTPQTHEHSPPPPSQTSSDVHKQVNKQATSPRSCSGLTTPRWPQALRCFRRTRSAICLALYRDTPIPTVAIVMAMGSTRLLWGCMRTSPETCLCTQDRRTDAVRHNSLMRGTIKTQCVEVLWEYGSFQRNVGDVFICWMWQSWWKGVEVHRGMVCGRWGHGVVELLSFFFWYLH